MLPLMVPSAAMQVSSHLTGFYDPKTFFTHAALLRQTFVHCAIFPTAASRRSLGRVSVPVWPYTLSGRLLIVVLVSHYLTNKLIRHRLIFKRRSFSILTLVNIVYLVLALLSKGYPSLKSRLFMHYSPVRH